MIRSIVIFPSKNKDEKINETIKPVEITEVIAYGELFNAKYVATPKPALPVMTSPKLIRLLTGAINAYLKDATSPVRRP